MAGSTRRALRGALGAACAAASVSVPGVGVAAAPSDCPPGVSLVASGELSYLREGEPLGRTIHAAPAERRLSAAPATPVELALEGFTAEGERAFRYAVDLWRSHVHSPQTIRILAAFTDALHPGVLGGAVSNGYLVNVTDPTVPLYPVALGEALTDRDWNAGAPDILVAINSTMPWHHATDGRPPADRYDLATVVFHELTHGLAAAGTFDVLDGVGSWGPPSGIGAGRPAVYDTFVADGSGRRLVESYESHSFTLGTALRAGPLRFAGPATKAATGGSGVTLFTPGEWLGGSSVYHFTPGQFAQGTPDSLLNPALSKGVAVHDVGPVIEAVLEDLGWPDAGVGLPGPPTGVAVAPGDAGADLTWTAPTSTGGSPVTGYAVTITPPGAAPVVVSATSSPFTVSGLVNGTTYSVSVAAVNEVGTGPASAPVTVTPQAAATTSTSIPTTTSTPTSTTTTTSSTTTTTTPTSTSLVVVATPSSVPCTPSATVLGTTFGARPASNVGPSSGGSVRSQLPRTGSSPWSVVAVGALLAAVGLALRRRALRAARRR